jgi:hypothetical protein
VKVGFCRADSHEKSKRFAAVDAPYSLSDTKTERPEWTSFQRLVQDMIAGDSRRHTFSQWELEFLLDLQNARLRKSSRESLLRKYLRIVNQYCTDGALEPPRLCSFLASLVPARSATIGG